MADTPDRKTGHLSAYPDIVVIYRGVRVEEPRGLENDLQPQIDATVAEQPEGFLPRERHVANRLALGVPGPLAAGGGE